MDDLVRELEMQHNEQHFLHVSARVHSPAVPTSESVKVTKLIQAFRDYLPHVQHEA